MARRHRLTLVIGLLAAACNSDDTPEPTATSIPAPTATAVSTATAIPTATATSTPPAPSTAQPPITLEDLILTPDVTGQDLIDRVSEAEAACIRAAVGDFAYQVLLGISMMEAMASASGSTAAPLFNCLTPDNVVLLGAGIIDLEAGGRSPEARACLQAVLREHPEYLYVRMQVEPPEGAIVAREVTHSVAAAAFACLSAEEQVSLSLRIWNTPNPARSVPGRELITQLEGSGADACLRESLSAEKYEAFLESRIHTFPEGVRALGDCAPADLSTIFLAGFEVVFGGGG